MYKKGDIVVHPTSGVCKITDIKAESFGGLKKVRYYVLRTVYDRSATIIHIPVDGERIKLRKLLSKEEIISIIHSVSVNKPLRISDGGKRRERFNCIIRNGDYGEILQMICEIYIRQKERVKNGKKPYVSDSRALNDAENILYQEFAHILGIEQGKVAEFIISELNIG